MDKQLLAVNASQQLVRQNDFETMFAAVRVMALPIDPGFIFGIRHALTNKSARWFAIGSVIRIEVD